MSGADKGIFEIDGGVLTFKNSPNFEGAKDGDEDPDSSDDQGAGDNVYQVTVHASGGKVDAVVTVINDERAWEREFRPAAGAVNEGPDGFLLG